MRMAVGRLGTPAVGLAATREHLAEGPAQQGRRLQQCFEQLALVIEPPVEALASGLNA
jgi:hypothetical protein